MLKNLNLSACADYQYFFVISHFIIYFAGVQEFFVKGYFVWKMEGSPPPAAAVLGAFLAVLDARSGPPSPGSSRGSGAAAQLTGCQGAELEISGAASLGRCRALSCAGGKDHRHRLPPPWAQLPPSRI